MADPFMGEVRIMAFGFAPRGWAQCNGQLLSIQQNQALFSILGTFYGGDGRNTFGLPDLRGRTGMGTGGSSGYVIGQQGGEVNHTLTYAEMAQHNHALVAEKTGGTDQDPATEMFGSGGNIFNNAAGTPNTQLAGNAIANSGGNQPHNNMQPYTTLNYCIALQGTYPPHS